LYPRAHCDWRPRVRIEKVVAIKPVLVQTGACDSNQCISADLCTALPEKESQQALVSVITQSVAPGGAESIACAGLAFHASAAAPTARPHARRETYSGCGTARPCSCSL